MDLNKILEETLDKAARNAVESVIAKNSGYGIEGPLKDIIKARAQEIIKEPEIDKKLRDAIVRWISQAY